MIGAVRNMKVLAANQKLGYNLAEPGFSIVICSHCGNRWIVDFSYCIRKNNCAETRTQHKVKFLRRARFGVQVTQEELESGLHMLVYQFCLLFYLRSN